MSIEFEFVFEQKGPISNGQWAEQTQVILNEAATTIGQQGVDDVKATLVRVLRNPTGFYESNIRMNAVAEDVVVHDNGVIYGPWLEGVGSRNFPRTRFRGYHTFRAVERRLQSKAPEIADRVLKANLWRLEGGG